MSKEIKELKQEIANLKQAIKRLEYEIESLYDTDGHSVTSVVSEMKAMKRAIMEYTDNKIYFENAW